MLVGQVYLTGPSSGAQKVQPTAAWPSYPAAVGQALLPGEWHQLRAQAWKLEPMGRRGHRRALELGPGGPQRSHRKR